MDHCLSGYPADPTDAQLTSSEPEEWMASTGAVDLLLPKLVLDWMHRNKWMEAHDAWHNVRRCNSFLSFPSSPSVNICDEHPDLVAKYQECSGPEDGLAFLVEHRHMIQGFKQAFPEHTELFDGFEEFPFDAQGVPEQWRGRFGTGWSSRILEAARMLEDIENQLDQFPTEGALGSYIQCGPGMAVGGMGSSIHSAMHFKWTVSESPYALANQVVDLGNYMFWKLHGWIDNVWERYRAAKGLAPDERVLKQALVDQCLEMHRLSLLFDPSLAQKPGAPRPHETGYFVDHVRPVLDASCSGCHSGSAPMGGLSFAKQLSSSDVVAQLVDTQAMNGGQFKRVMPGQPAQSWLYLKVTDMARNAACTGTCNTQSMPPTGQVELSADQLESIREWIADGALPPAPAAP